MNINNSPLKTNSWLPTTLPSRLFLGVTLLETIVDVILVGIVLKNSFGNTGVVDRILAKDDGSVLPVYLGLFVLAHLFQLFLAFDALRNKNTLQVVGLCIFNTLFLAYSIIVVSYSLL